jgi:hypothetical protein
MKSSLELFFISNEMQLIKNSRKKPKRNFGFITLFFFANDLSYQGQTIKKSRKQMKSRNYNFFFL